LGRGEGFQGIQRRFVLPAPPLRHTQQQHRRRMPGDDLEDLIRLFRRELGVAVEQARRVIQRDFQSADRIRPSAQRSEPLIPDMFWTAIRKRSCPLVKFTTPAMRQAD
jgi:hypothetical protein